MQANVYLSKSEPKNYGRYTNIPFDILLICYRDMIETIHQLAFLDVPSSSLFTYFWYLVSCFGSKLFLMLPVVRSFFAVVIFFRANFRYLE